MRINHATMSDDADVKLLDDAVGVAISRASREGGKHFGVYFQNNPFRVWVWDASNETPSDTTRYCIAHKWDENTVEVRFPGGESSFYCEKWEILPREMGKDLKGR